MKTIIPLLVAACLSAASLPARAQTSGAGKVDLTFTQTNSFGQKPNKPVYAIGVQTNGQVLIGGTFDQPLNKYGLARLNVNGTPDGSFAAYVKRNNTLGNPTLSGSVNKILRRPDGGFFITGTFHAVGNVAGYTNLALLDAGGNHVTNFIPLVPDADMISGGRCAVENDNRMLVNLQSNLVYRLSATGAVVDAMLLTNVGNISSLTADPNGGFYVAGTMPNEIPVRARVFRFNADGSTDTNFNAPLFDNGAGTPAYTLDLPLAQPNGKVLVLGYFDSVGGVQRGGLCRLNLDGTLDPTFVPGANGVGTIYQGSLIGLSGITRLPDGRFIIFRNGPFRYDGIYRNGIGRISSGGALDSTFDPGTGPLGDNFGFGGDGWGIMTATSAADGNVYAGGSFTNFNNTGRQYIVRLNAGPASAKPTIDTHPVSQSVTNGVDVTFTVIATGPGTLTYLWKHNNVTIPGAASASLTVTNVDLGDVGAYVVTVVNSAGPTVSLPAILTVNGVSTPDLSGPNFQVTSPAGTFVLVTSNQFDFKGKAADNQGLGVLLYKQDASPWTQIPLTTNWAFTVLVNPGTNLFQITVGDTSGNYAVTQRFTAFYSVRHPLGLNLVGNGKVNGATNGQLFEIGRFVTPTATPGTGWLLTNWLVQVNGNTTLSTNKAVPFLMASNTVVTATFVDIAKPTLTITAPIANQRWSNEVFTVAGKVTDNNPNGTVRYQLNGGAWADATGWSNWTAVVNLIPGTNNVKAYAVDAAGNRSTTNTVNFVRVLTAPLGLNIVGNGKVTGGTNGQPFEIGKSVALTATPGTGWLLTNWLVQVNGNTTLSTNKATPFLMASNTVVTATFVDIAKPTLTITAPTLNQRWSNEVFTVAGKVTDNNPNGTVRYQLNGGAWTDANGWSNWTASVTLTPGTNSVKAYAVDAAGNRSTTNSVNFVRVLTTPLGLNIVGNGKVAGGANGQLFEIGKSVVLTATPGTGWLLTNWLVQVNGNTTLSTNKATPFLMASNTVVTATFVDAAKPTLTITAPTLNQRWSNEVFTVAGKVADNNTNGTVRYQLNGGAWTDATGWSNWTASVTLTPGTNNVKAYAVDAAGNRSTTNSANVIYVLAYCLSEYFYPAPVGTHMIYDGLDWDGFPAQLKVEMKDDSYPILTHSGTAIVSNYFVNVLYVESAYGTYVSGTGQFFPYDSWDEYFISDNCTFGYMGSDDGFESTRADRGFVWTNRVTVGQTLSLTRNVYVDGDYVGQGTLKLQLLDVSTVTVPAGTFPGCLRLRSTLTAGGSTAVRDDWLAQGIGMVKQQGISGDGALERWELIHLETPGSGSRPATVAARAPLPSPELRLSLPASASAALAATPSMALKLAGPAGATVIIESSSDMIHWTPVHTNALSADGLSLAIPIDLNQPGQFFRARFP